MSGYKRVNYYELCRLCTTNDGEKIPIFYGEGLKKEIQIKLGLLSIQVSEEDTLPNYICRTCLDKMEKCLDFRNICFTAAYALDNYATTLQNNEDFKKDGTLYIKNNIELPNLHLVKLSDGTFHSFNSSTTINNSFSDPVIDISKSDDESILTSWKPEEVIVKEDIPIKIDDSDVELVEVDVDEHETKKNSDTESCRSECIEISDSADKQYKCEYCPKTFKKRTGFILHQISHKTEHKCDICLKKFTRNAHLTKHKKIHQESIPHVCEYCGKEFRINAYYLLHKQMHIKKGLTDSDLPFKCPTCFKLFGRKYLLDNHLTEHVLPIEKTVGKSKTKIDQDPLEFNLPKKSSSSETPSTRVLRPIRNREK